MKELFILLVIQLINIALSDKFEESIHIKYINSLPTIQINLGQPAQTFDVVISTTESISWVPSISCSDCDGESNSSRLLSDNSTQGNSTITMNLTKGRYYEEFSSSSSNKNQTIEVQSIEGSLKGQRVSDNISIGKTLKGVNFNFVSAETMIKRSPAFGKEGVLGLSYKSINGNDFGILNILKNSGSIENKVFSIGNNEVLIGNYPTQVKQFPTKFNSCNVTLTEGLLEEYMDSWVCDLSHILIGSSKNFTDSDEIQGRAVFDSSYDNIEIPVKYIHLFKEKYFAVNFKNKLCNQEDSDNSITFTCEKQENLEDISFIIGGYGLIVPGIKLFTEVKSGNSTLLKFNVVFMKDTRNFIRIGRILLDEYLITYDSDKGLVGFYGDNKKNFQKEWSLWWNSGFKSITSQEHFNYLIAACIALGSAILLVITCLVIQAFKSKSSDQVPPLYEEEMNNI